MNKRNLQYRRTDKAIVQAFLTLLEKKSYETITVQNILDEALVSRNTFYLHFKDKEEIAEILYHDLLNDFHNLKEQSFRGSVDETNFEPQLQAFISERQRTIKLLSKIHTEKFQIDDFFKEYFFHFYQNHDCHKKCKRSSLQMESHLYAAIMSEIILNTPNHTPTITINVEEIELAIAHCFMFSIGVRDMKKQKELLAPLFEKLNKSYI